MGFHRTYGDASERRTLDDHDVTGDNAPLKASRQAWIALAVLALPTMLIFMDITVLFLALPHLSADLGASSTQQLWITDIYAFMMAGFLVTMGRLGDRIGRRRLLLAGAAAFGAASVLAAYSSHPVTLIAARAVLGVAGAAMTPATLALITVMFRDRRELGTAIALWTTSMMAGVALGPVIGGLLLGSFWWGSVFLLGLPVIALLLATGPALLPEVRVAAAGRLDLTSVALSLATILPVVYGLKELARGGMRSGHPPEARAVVAVAAGLAFGLIFVRRQRTLASPLLDLRLFGIRVVSGSLAIGMLFAGIQSGTNLLAVQHLQLVEGLSPARAGLWLLLPVIALVIGMNVTPMLVRRIRPAYVLAAGGAVALGGQLVLTQVGGAGSLAVIVVGLSVAYLGVGPVGPLVNGVVMSSVPPDKAGSASSLPSTSGELGVAMGIAAMGSLGAIVYRGAVSVPAGVPSGGADAAREGIVGAMSTAAQLPAPMGAELLESAREAFTTGLHAVAGVNAVLCLAVAVIATITLRQIPPTV